MLTTQSRRGRWRVPLVISSVLAVLAAGIAIGVPAQASTPQDHTITYQCDPNLPGYGLNSAGGAWVNVNVGDTVTLVFDGGACREGSMHFRGDMSMFETTPAWSGSCCTYIPSGTRYVMKVAKWTPDNRYGTPGWVGLSFFKNTYAGAQQVYLLVAPPPPGPPDAPIVTDKSAGENSASVSFKAPYDNGSSIIRYEWTITEPTNMGWWASVRSNYVMFYMYGLKPNTEYKAQLRAVNGYGAGTATTITFKTRSGPPGAPTNLIADPGDGEAKIAFTPGTDGGSPIKKYQYRANGGGWQDVPGGDKTSPVTIPGLTNYESYDIELRAVNEDGEVGTASETVTVEPGPADTNVTICHWTGDDYEQVTTTTAIFRGKGEHGAHSDDIIPEVVGVGGARNWDSGGAAIWLNGCEKAKPADTDKDGRIDLVDTDDDGDGTPDASDRDDDGDGVYDCNDDDYEQKTDSDGDGIPDALTSDDDGDGIEDSFDSDRNGDGRPDVTDPDLALPDDSDGDGTPDAQEGDKDGDCIADVKDADDNGDGIADAEVVDLDNDGVIEADETAETAEEADGGAVQLANVTGECRDANVPAAPRDRDHDGVPDTRDKDMDGDGIPNAADPDVDGDLVLDARDGDANGDGIAETKDQPLTSAYALPSLQAGKATVIVSGPLETVAGQNAFVAVECVAKQRSKFALAPFGDIAAPSSKSLCGVEKSGGKVTLTVNGGVPTLVTVRVTAPAVGDFRAFEQIEQVTVK